MNRREFLAGAGSATVVATAGCLEEATEVLFGPMVDVPTDRVEELIFEKVNERRTQRPGYEPFEHNERAAEAAREHARDMATREYYSHTSLDGETQGERYGFCGGGENINQTNLFHALDDTRETDDGAAADTLAEAFVEEWMDSKPHRERGIYGEYWRSSGVGVAIDDSEMYYAVQGFCQ